MANGMYIYKFATLKSNAFGSLNNVNWIINSPCFIMFKILLVIQKQNINDISLSLLN